jgi:hypothetical protein
MHEEATQAVTWMYRDMHGIWKPCSAHTGWQMLRFMEDRPGNGQCDGWAVAVIASPPPPSGRSVPRG